MMDRVRWDYYKIAADGGLSKGSGELRDAAVTASE